MTRFLLVRHGVTTWIEEELLHGVTDVPLSEYGKNQAQLTAALFKDIKVDKIYSSPLSRTMQTAEPISAVTGVSIIEIPELMEMHFGFMEGKRDWWPAVRGKKLLVLIYQAVRLFAGYVSGDPFHVFLRRAGKTFDRIAEENPQGTVVIVTHSAVLRAIFTHIFGGNPIMNKQFGFATASVSEMDRDAEGNYHLVAVNRNEHLPKDIDL